MDKGIIHWVAAFLLAIAFVGFVCMDSSCSDNNTSYQGNVVVCPNPDCPLHNPTFNLNNGERPIDMEIDVANQRIYLCQVCGTRWTE